MKAKALISFHAYNIMASTGEELEIANKDIMLDLEKLGWIERLEHEVSETNENDMTMKRTKRATK